jgi:hypothetical protein
MSSNNNNHFTLDIEHDWEDLSYVYIQEINNILKITITKEGRFDFQSSFCKCFIVDLRMQHNFCCVNLIGRS